MHKNRIFFHYPARFVYLCSFKSMRMSEKSSSKRRVAGSYFMSMMSIALVLFLLGVFALLMMHAQKLSNHLKENICFEVVMNNNVKEENILRVQKEIEALPSVKSTKYITKEEALQRLSEELGENFQQGLGNEENPLSPSIEVRFNAEWANNDSIKVIQGQLLKKSEVKEIYYHESLVGLINHNVHRIGFVLMAASLVLLIIAITLIHNTIRLSIYSKRFLVRSMQLVGATPAFIRKPFVKSGISQGLFGALLADAFLALLLYGITKRLPELTYVQDRFIIIGIFIGIIVLGILLGGLSTHSALRKYLNADVDRLYA